MITLHTPLPILTALVLMSQPAIAAPAELVAGLTDSQIETRIQQVMPKIRKTLQSVQQYQQEAQQQPGYASRQQALQAYRNFWKQRLNNATVGDMLGNWQGPFGYAITIFPTAKPDRVCIQYADEEDTGVYLAQVRGNRLQSDNGQTTSIYLRDGNALTEVYLGDETNFTIWPSARLPRRYRLHQFEFAKLGCITETDIQILKSQSLEQLTIRNRVCVSNFRTLRNPTGKPVPVRSEAASNAAITDTLPSGTLVQADEGEPQAAWISITGPKQVSGWVQAQFVLNPRKTPLQDQMRVRTLDGDALNVRVSANPGDRIIGTVPNGTVVTVLDHEGYRAKIKTPQGLTGFVVDQYLDCL
ncbi:hypothetical protein BST81_12150 [Leptolyngbya sp. 'hensonii']|uniref:SH3 domain-containing protein n=1 Tax=Leptolyngbya sp. 'hensonii' TaxID=1922337 RepID=UPI00094F6CA2|nr:SH3 domain-containing protein [Leptolyngbya sp. 'hensonii']OLP17813.1 hypothetical protein BST81_12150 [Leptolyngbya sp. 'hensonii']